jgi:hypothetical protein
MRNGLRVRNQAGKALTAEFAVALTVFLLVTLFPLINLIGFAMGAGTQYLMTVQCAGGAGASTTWTDALSAMDREAVIFANSGFGKFANLQPVGGHNGTGTDLYLIETSLAANNVLAYGPNTGGPTPLNSNNNVYEYQVRSTFDVGPFVNMSQMPWIGNVPGVGRPARLSFVAHRNCEFTDGLAMGATGVPIVASAAGGGGPTGVNGVNGGGANGGGLAGAATGTSTAGPTTVAASSSSSGSSSSGSSSSGGNNKKKKNKKNNNATIAGLGGSTQNQNSSTGQTQNYSTAQSLPGFAVTVTDSTFANASTNPLNTDASAPTNVNIAIPPVTITASSTSTAAATHNTGNPGSSSTSTTSNYTYNSAIAPTSIGGGLAASANQTGSGNQGQSTGQNQGQSSSSSSSSSP